jgi:3-hydroxybutyrate dehydrogenase
MLSKKTVLVTGSTSGIGLAIATSFAKQNCNLIINGLSSEAETSKLLSELSALTRGKVIYSSANLMKVSEIEELIKMASKAFKGIDILVNNAGIQYVSPIEAFPVEKWDQIISLNLSAAFHLSRLTIPHMRTQEWGRIINISSAHGLVASPDKSAYVAAKHGLVGLTKVVALETAGQGITCNAICPGWVLTPLVQKQIEDQATAQGISIEESMKHLLEEKQPSLQFVSAEEIGELAVFLCSHAANQITGVALPIDGGWTAR